METLLVPGWAKASLRPCDLSGAAIQSDKLRPGAVVEGVVRFTGKFGMVVALGDQLEVMVTKAHMGDTFVYDPRGRYKVSMYGCVMSSSRGTYRVCCCPTYRGWDTVSFTTAVSGGLGNLRERREYRWCHLFTASHSGDDFNSCEGMVNASPLLCVELDVMSTLRHVHDPILNLCHCM